MIECSSEAPLAMVGSSSPYRSQQRSQSLSHKEEVERALQAFAKLLRRSYPKIKAWPSMLGVGHEPDKSRPSKKRELSEAPRKLPEKTLQRREGYFMLNWTAYGGKKVNNSFGQNSMGICYERK